MIITDKLFLYLINFYYILYLSIITSINSKNFQNLASDDYFNIFFNFINSKTIILVINLSKSSFLSSEKTLLMNKRYIY